MLQFNIYMKGQFYNLLNLIPRPQHTSPNIYSSYIVPLTTSTIISNTCSIIYTCSLLSYFLSLPLNHYHYHRIELSCIFTMLEGKAVIGETDMLQATQQDALNLAAKALDISDATEIARFIKKEFDRRYGPGWQCVVGTDFGSFVLWQFHPFPHW